MDDRTQETNSREPQYQGGTASHEGITPSHFVLRGYLVSAHSFWFWTILALTISTIVAVFAIQEGSFPIAYVRYALGSIFTLLLPGYSLIKALFPAKEINEMERISLSMGMSFVLVSITALVLTYTPWGITGTSITFSLLALTASFATVAIMRDYLIRVRTAAQK